MHLLHYLRTLAGGWFLPVPPDGLPEAADLVRQVEQRHRLSSPPPPFDAACVASIAAHLGWQCALYEALMAASLPCVLGAGWATKLVYLRERQRADAAMGRLAEPVPSTAAAAASATPTPDPDDDDLSSVFVLADGPGDHGVDAATFYGLVADGTLPEDDYSDPLDCLP